MTRSIKSYKDLLQERERLERLLEVQKAIVLQDIQQIKEELKPVRNVFEFLKKMFTKDKTSLLLNLGSDFAINAFVKNFILSRTGWLTKLVVPFFLKNFSSHFISEQKDKWLEKLRSWLHGNKDGKEKQPEPEKEW